MFGTVTLSYTPPTDDHSEAALTMRFSSEANLKDILRHFENFLRAMEYPLGYDEHLVTGCSTPDCPIDLTHTVSGDKVTFFTNKDNMNLFLKDFTLGK